MHEMVVKCVVAINLQSHKLCGCEDRQLPTVAAEPAPLRGYFPYRLVLGVVSHVCAF